MSVRESAAVAVEEMPVEEGRRLLDEAARRYLNMTGEEFVATWESGRFGWAGQCYADAAERRAAARRQEHEAGRSAPAEPQGVAGGEGRPAVDGP